MRKSAGGKEAILIGCLSEAQTLTTPSKSKSNLEFNSIVCRAFLMQSSLNLHPNSSRLQIPWKFHKHYDPYLFPQSLSIPRNRNFKNLKPPKTLAPSNFIATSSEYERVEINDEPPAATLPLVIHRSGEVSRYLWDGTHLKLVCCDSETLSSLGFGDGFHRFFQISSLAIRRLFVPLQVQGNYMGYLKWKLLHRIFSSTLQVLATQAMFRAIGFGSSQALSSAAALNWVLKDGLGRLSRCIYSASLGSAFDTNLKRVRFSTSILFSLSIGVELLTPTFPQHFLLLATIANIAKSISRAALLATGSAVHRSFAVADNLGEVSAKAQIQTVCFDNVGLMFAAILNVLCKNNKRLQAGLPLLLYPIFSVVDLFAIYQGLKHVHLQTLTKDRLEIIIDRWIHTEFVPSPEEVSNEEGIFFRRKGSALWPIRIGVIEPNDLSSNISMVTLHSLRREDFYFICVESFHRGLMRKQHQGLLLSLRERANTSDIITGLLQACHVRNRLIMSRNKGELIFEAIGPCSLHREWFSLVENSKQYAHEEVNLLIEEVRRAGWAVRNILLSTPEQIRYSFEDD